MPKHHFSSQTLLYLRLLGMYSSQKLACAYARNERKTFTPVTLDPRPILENANCDADYDSIFRFNDK